MSWCISKKNVIFHNCEKKELPINNYICLSYRVISLFLFHCTHSVFVGFYYIPARRKTTRHVWRHCVHRKHCHVYRMIVPQIPCCHCPRTPPVTLHHQHVETFVSRIKCVHPKCLKWTEFLQKQIVQLWPRDSAIAAILRGRSIWG